jgi:hypothetical protein
MPNSTQPGTPTGGSAPSSTTTNPQTVVPAAQVVATQPGGSDALGGAAAPTPDANAGVTTTAGDALASGVKEVVIPQSALKGIKSKALQKGVEQGKSEAQTALDTEAKQAGFESHAALLAFAKQSRQTSPAVEANTTTTDTPPAAADADKPQLVQLPDGSWVQVVGAPTQNVEELQASYAQQIAERDAKLEALTGTTQTYEQQLAESKSEMQVREGLYRSGVEDVDYTYSLLKREIDSFDDAGMAAFDQKAWLGNLKKERPYLFGKHVPQPSTTGSVAGNDTPAPPNPGQVANTNGDASKFDARTADPQSMNARLEALGFDVPQMGA